VQWGEMGPVVDYLRHPSPPGSVGKLEMYRH
jgi:hypothetical protein